MYEGKGKLEGITKEMDVMNSWILRLSSAGVEEGYLG
jgi:hypothetical protein